MSFGFQSHKTLNSFIDYLLRTEHEYLPSNQLGTVPLDITHLNTTMDDMTQTYLQFILLAVTLEN